MKYAFFISTLIISLFFSFSVMARDHKINALQDSAAIMTIAQFLSENGEDLNVSFRLSDNKLKVTSTESCEDVNSVAVIRHLESALLSLLRVFPDEELPIEEAIQDLSTYLGEAPLKKCTIIKSNLQKQINSSYYFDPSERVHVKIDTITLKSR